MPEQFRQHVNVWQSYRPIIPGSIVVLLLIAFLGGAFVGFRWPDSPVALRWLVGLLLGLVIMAPVFALRTRMLKGAADRARLEVDDRGLTAFYEGTRRSLTWAQVARFEKIKKPVKDAEKTKSTGGVMIIGAVNAVTSATAPTSLGVIGVGEWTAEQDMTRIGSELMALSGELFGAVPQGAVVPIWFDDYDEPAQARLRELVAQHRPDLAGGAH